jgi:acyl carrier protein
VTATDKGQEMEIETSIRRIVGEHGRLEVDIASVTDDDDLYERGMTSHAVVNVMLELEDEMDFEFPDEMLKKHTFQTLANIRGALETIGVGAEA